MDKLQGKLSSPTSLSGKLSNLTLRGYQVELRVQNQILQWKYENDDDDSWKDLIDLSTLVTDYATLDNLPAINGVTLLGKKTLQELGIAARNQGINSITRNGITYTVTRSDGSTFTFNQQDTVYDDATTTSAGLMSSSDKVKLNGIESGSQINVLESVSVNGTRQGIIEKNIDISIPTKVSDLDNDEGFLTEETDPTVPSWAKQPSKPTYTAQEVGALPSNTHIPANVSELVNDAGYLTEHQDISNIEDAVAELTTKLNAVADSDDATLDQLSEIVAYIKNNKNLIDGITSGKISVDDIVDNLTSTAANKPLSAKQGKALKDMIDGIVVPTKVSDLANDAGYLTQHQDISGKQDVIADLATIRSGASLGATALQEETDPTVPAWAKASTKPTYTAAEVGALPDDTVIPSKVSELTNDSGYLTQHQDISGKANTADLATVATSGNYTDLLNKPTIPAVPTKVSAFTNDASYTNEKYVDDAITAALADVVGIEYHVCTTEEYDDQTYLPTLAGEVGVIYLVPKPASLIGTAETGTADVSGNNIYYEFIYNGRSFEMIGDTQVSLDGYLEDSDVSTDAQVQSVITEVFGGAL